MPDQMEYTKDLARAYTNKKVLGRRLSQDDADRYVQVLMRMFQILFDASLRTTPSKLGEQEIHYLLKWYSEVGLDVDTQKWMFSILNGFLKHHDNRVYEKMYITWPPETRTNVDWLTPEEAVRLLAAAQGSERIIIHMELRLWLRRCEVLRLKKESIKELVAQLMDAEESTLEGVIDVHGKGRGGGKWRTLAWAPDTREELEYYETLRASMLERARNFYDHSWQRGKRKRPKEPFREPEDWVIYQKGKRASGYSESGLDGIVARVAARAGIKRKIGNHTLRRTGARIAYFAGVKLVEIMEGLGHASEKQTIRYLGLTVEQLAKAQVLIADYLQVVKARMQLKAGEAVVLSRSQGSGAKNSEIRIAR